jgi:hypothetical protein
MRHLLLRKPEKLLSAKDAEESRKGRKGRKEKRWQQFEKRIYLSR